MASARYRCGSGEIEGIETLTVASTAAGGIEAHFAPAAGMIGCSLRHRGEEVLGLRNGLRGYVDQRSTMGIPLLYPWANRLAEREFELAGRRVNLDTPSPRVKLDQHGLPIHGLLTAIPGWRVEEHAADRLRARLRASFAFDEAPGLLSAFPFAHRLQISVELREATLSVTTSVLASSDAPVPVAFGFHPYLRLPGTPRADWRISAPVRERLVLDDRGLPTGDRTPAAIEPGPLGDRRFDDAFAVVDESPFVLAGGDRRIELWLRHGYPFGQLYAPGGDLLAFEPMTAPTNALVSGDDLRVVAPGDGFEAAFELRLG